MMRQMACIWDGDQNGSWNGQTGLAFDYECTASDTKERMSSNFFMKPLLVTEKSLLVPYCGI